MQCVFVYFPYFMLSLCSLYNMYIEWIRNTFSEINMVLMWHVHFVNAVFRVIADAIVVVVVVVYCIFLLLNSRVSGN
jgi:hypothetical protein